VSGSTSMGTPWPSRAETSGTREGGKNASQHLHLGSHPHSLLPATGRRPTVVVLPLPLLLLKLEGDSADGSTLDPLHQVGRESGNLVAETLGRDDGDLITDLLVGVAVGRPREQRGGGEGDAGDSQVESKTGVVLLDDDSRRSLNGLGTNSTPANRVKDRVSVQSSPCFHPT
jgi:hypothetical protein